MKLFIVCLLLAAVAAAKVDYSGYMVMRTVAQNDHQMQHLQLLRASPLDFWSSAKEGAVDILVSPASYYTVARSLSSVNLTHVIHINDVGQLIRDEERNIAERQASYQNGGFDYENYHRYGELVALVDDFVNKSTLVTKKVIGTTYEGRDIVTAVVSSDLSAKRPIIYLECAMHAREWMTPATCVWILNQLVTNYDTDAEVKKIIDSFDWLITPVSNPDGYEYTWTDDRLWRKNRSVRQGQKLCIGTDPNRNFDNHFGGPGTSSNPCSLLYHGPFAFSEKESCAMRDLLIEYHGRVKASLSIHAFSQFWMTPYGYQTGYPPEYKEMYRVMDAAVKALEATYGTKYKYGTIADVIYLAAGSTADYAYENEGIIYAYALELRDDPSGSHGGFDMPPEYIKPTAIETWNGIRTMAIAILNP